VFVGEVVEALQEEEGETPMKRDETILLVEDNPDDELLTRRALKKSNICNEVVVARDGAEALDYLFLTGAYERRYPLAMPQVILFDLDLPKVDGLEVLRHIRSDERTKLGEPRP
jgi:two-component system response regulator